MRKSIITALAILLVLTAFATPGAQQAKKIAILPFTVNSSENINYVRDGIWDMLISRVTVAGKTDVLSKTSVLDTIDKQKKDLTQADVSAIGQRLKADFVVWGSITKIGDSISLDGKLLDVASNQSPVTLFEQTRGMNEVIPKISEFSQKIRSYVTGEALAVTAAPATPAPGATAATVAGGGSGCGGGSGGCAGQIPGDGNRLRYEEGEDDLHGDHQPGSHHGTSGLGPEGILDEPEVRNRVQGAGHR